jgi:hypothetical protein
MKPKNSSKEKTCPEICFISLLTVIFLLNSVSAEPNELWSKITDGDSDYSRSTVAVDSDKNILVINGYTNSSCVDNCGSWEINWDFCLTKYDPEGNVIWKKTAGGDFRDFGYGVAVDSENNIIVTGITNSFGRGLMSDALTIKYDSNGNILWNKTAGGGSWDHFRDVAVDSKNNIIVTGNTHSFGSENSDVWTIEYDSNGNILWNKTTGGDDFEEGLGVAIDSGNNIIVTGYKRGFTRSFGEDFDVWTIKYDANGNQLWNKTAGKDDFEEGVDVAVDSKNNIIVTGFTGPSSAGNDGLDVWTIKYDANGNQLWNKTAGGDRYDSGSGVAVDSDNNIFVVATTNSFRIEDNGIWIIEYDPNGNIIWDKKVEGNYSRSGVAVDSNDNIIVTGYTPSYRAGHFDLRMIKYTTSEIKKIKEKKIVTDTTGEKINDVGENASAKKEVSEQVKKDINDSTKKISEEEIEKIFGKLDEDKTEGYIKDEEAKEREIGWKGYTLLGVGILILILLFIQVKKFKKSG